MSGSSIESVWIPNYGTGLRLGGFHFPHKPKRFTRGLGQASLTVSRPSKSRISAERRYLTAVLADLSFDDDVVEERCFQADPFKSRFKVSLKQSRRLSAGRCRNDISYLSKPVDPLSYLKRVKPVSSSRVKSQPVSAGSETKDGTRPADGSPPTDISRSTDSDEVSLQQRKSSGAIEMPYDGPENGAEWDECLMTKLSANTARWIAHHPSTTEDARKRLHDILDTVHGPASIQDRVELLEEDHSGAEAAAAAKKVKKPWLSDKDV